MTPPHLPDDPSRQEGAADDLLGYVLDLLEADDIERVERRIESEPAFRERVEAARRQTAPLAADDNIAPPPGLADRTLEFVFAAAGRRPLVERDWVEAGTSRMRPLDFIVAITVLGLAITLLFPAIATIRGDQARVACADRLRDLGIALNLYADQENGYFPYIALDGPLSHAGVFSLALKQRDLIEDERSLLCPSANSGVAMLPDMDEYLQAQSSDDPYRRDWVRRNLAGSYGYGLGYRVAGNFFGPHRRIAGPLVADRPARSDDLADRDYVNSPNHDGRGQNVLFGDGQVRWLPGRVYGGDDLFRNRECEVEAGISFADTVIAVSEESPRDQPEAAAAPGSG